jgi:hypothetical protein
MTSIGKADDLITIARLAAEPDHARAVLTDGPAVQSREPASVATQPSDELVATWIAEVWHEGTPVRVAASDLHLASRAAEWGARWGHQPVPLAAEGYVGELIKRLRIRAASLSEVGANLSQQGDAIYFTRAADLLEQRHPEPVPPSLAKRALHILGTHGDLSCAEHDTIRRALEALDD